MAEAGPAAAGLVAAVSLSAFGLAGALGAGLGGAALAAGAGHRWGSMSPCGTCWSSAHSTSTW